MRKQTGGRPSSDTDSTGKLNPGFWEPEFWLGYHRGLNRRRYGEIFGNSEEHQSWHDIPDNLEEEPSIERVARGMGYRAGYAGLTVEEATGGIKEFINISKEKYEPEAMET
jgi:hypothetical protein